ncbi:MAG: NAD(P)/FAD-dependent oxidoreductase [Myxococcota bacterium]
MDVKILVIGAGVVGLAVAQAVSKQRGPVLILEQHPFIGQETSSHNSEVLHAGLYYPQGSLKAQLCLEGNEILRTLHTRIGLPMKLCGKLVVAQAGEEEALEALMQKAQNNGVEELRWLSSAEIHQREPHIRAAAAFFSPRTGILDSHALMRWYLAQAEEQGAQLVTRTRVTGITRIHGGYEVETDGPDGAFTITSEAVVNAAGLQADKMAALVGLDIDRLGYRLAYCRGDYYSTQPRCWSWVRHLIYPVPSPHLAGLGIHVTLDLAGRMRLGPDTTWLQDDEPLSYRVDDSKRALFAAAVQRYLPALLPSDLEPELAGIRPKLQRPGTPPRDFVIQEESARGLPGFVNLVGIESPGLTASPAIGRMVASLLK